MTSRVGKGSAVQQHSSNTSGSGDNGEVLATEGAKTTNLGGAVSFKNFSKALGTSSGTFSRKMFQEKLCVQDRFVVKGWLESLLGQSFAPDGEDQQQTGASPRSIRDLTIAAGHKALHLRTLEDELKRGVVLCQVMNLLKPGTIPKYNKAPDGFPFKQMEVPSPLFSY